MTRLVWFQFFPSDWLSDANLASVSLQARGLWIELICLAHNCNPYGVLATNREAWSRERIYRSIKGDVNVTRAAFDELVGSGVLSQFGDDGLVPQAYYSRRMVRDAEKRERTTERSRKFRSKQDLHDATLLQRSCNADATLVQRSCNADATGRSQKSEIRITDKTLASNDEPNVTPPAPWAVWKRWDEITSALAPLLSRPEWTGYPKWVEAIDTVLQDAAAAGLTPATGDAESLVLDAIASAKTAGTQFSTPKGFRSWMGTVVARCVDSGCKPGEWPQDRSGDAGGPPSVASIMDAVRAKQMALGGKRDRA